MVRNLVGPLVIIFSLIGAVYTLENVFNTKPKELPEIKCKSLFVEDDGSGSSIYLGSTNGMGCGIWLIAPNGDRTHISGTEKAHYISMMKNNARHANIALAIDNDGSGMIQFVDSKGNVGFLSLEKVAALVK